MLHINCKLYAGQKRMHVYNETTKEYKLYNNNKNNYIFMQKRCKVVV